MSLVHLRLPFYKKMKENHRKRKKKKVTCLICGKQFYVKAHYLLKGQGKFCSRKCFGVWKSRNMRGEVHPRWKRKKVRCLVCNKEFYAQAHRLKKGESKFCSRKCMGIWKKRNKSGENHYNWRGGKTVKQECLYCGKIFFKWPSQINRKFCSLRCRGLFLRKELLDLKDQIRGLGKYNKWRKAVFHRDNYTCQKCGIRSQKGNNGVWLEAHHITPLIQILQKYKIKSLESAEKCIDLWDTKNGITLCRECHEKVHWGNELSN